MARYFKITACIPSLKRVRTGRELQNTYFTKLVPYENWFNEQQRIQKAGGKVLSVKLFTGQQAADVGVLD